MAAGAIHSLITADNSDFKAALASVESDTGRVMGRVGGIFKAQTRGARDLSGAILGTAATMTLVAAAAYKVGGGISGLIHTQERVNALVRTEREERARVLEAVQATVRARSVALGMEAATPNSDALLADMTKVREALAKAQEESRLRSGDASLLFGAESWAGGLVDVVDAMTGTGERAADAKKQVALLRDELGRLNKMAERAAELDRIAQQNARQGRVNEGRGLDRGMALALIRAEGRETEALREAERQRFGEQLEQITRLEAASGAAMEGRRAMAEALHKAEMDRIGREAGARERAARQSAAWAGMDADAVEARLLGHDKEAQKIQARIEHEKMLQSIRERSGIDERERSSRLAQADRIHTLRMAEIDRGGAGRTVTAPTIEAGVVRSSALLGQVFGGAGAQSGEKPAREETAKKHLDIAGQQLMQLREMARNTGIARFA